MLAKLDASVRQRAGATPRPDSGGVVAQLNVDPQVLNRYGAVAQNLGTEVRAQAARGSFDTAAMATVFGLIGADFIAVASMVTSTHNRQVDTVGGDLLATGTAITVAGSSYTDADDTAAESLNLATTTADTTRV